MAKKSKDFDLYRVRPSSRSVAVDMVVGAMCPWRVRFFVDGVDVGGGQYQTADQADDAAVDFMFSGDLDAS